jgi:hypothetical protein
MEDENRQEGDTKIVGTIGSSHHRDLIDELIADVRGNT